MAVSNIPVLSPDYLPFDWNDWLNSLAALVPGGSTSDFEKECWNAIVSKVADVVIDSGLDWDSKYTTIAGAKITEVYGDLYAKAFNSLRHNIDNAVPVLRWGWANDPAFRGYIGRKDFRGVDEYGENAADDVYPEYFIELVNRLNFLITVLTGESASIMCGNGLAYSTDSAYLVPRPAEPLMAEGQGLSTSEAMLLPRIAAPLFVKGEILASLYKAKMQSPHAGPMEHASHITFLDNASVQAAKAGHLGECLQHIQSLNEALIEAFKSHYIVASGYAITNSDGEVTSAVAERITAEETSKSTTDAECTAASGQAVFGQGAAESVGFSDLTSAESYPIRAGGFVATTAESFISAPQSAAAAGGGIAVSLSESSVSSAWYPPVWVEGGLWIRQSHSVTQNENGELVIV